MLGYLGHRGRQSLQTLGEIVQSVGQGSVRIPHHIITIIITIHIIITITIIIIMITSS